QHKMLLGKDITADLPLLGKWVERRDEQAEMIGKEVMKGQMLVLLDSDHEAKIDERLIALSGDLGGVADSDQVLKMRISLGGIGGRMPVEGDGRQRERPRRAAFRDQAGRRA